MTTLTTTDLEVAREFAEAYAAVDAERFRGVAHEQLRHRELNPGGYLEYVGADRRIAELARWLERYGEVQLLEIAAERVGGRVLTKNVWKLEHGERSWLLRFDELLTIADGKVVAADVLCAGPEPER